MVKKSKNVATKHQNVKPLNVLLVDDSENTRKIVDTSGPPIMNPHASTVAS